MATTLAARMFRIATPLCMAFAAAGTHALAATRATSYSEAGDPPRWYVPAETPREKFENAAREARNALADAIRECKSSSSPKRCEAEARDQYREDMARARDFLAPSRQLA